MRTLTKHFLLILIASISLCGCMQHNGHIGDWFGTWKLESITVDGVEDASYAGNIFFQFQANVVRIADVSTDISNSVTDCFGSWSEEGSTLILNFGYTADNRDGNFTPPAITRLERTENILTVSQSSSRSMTWTLDRPASDDGPVTYTLKKQ